jgi:trehalose 6-phosphate synthase/phosphatase
MKPLGSQNKTKLLSDYRRSGRRLLLLDYDGTLIPFFGRPEEARPGHGLLSLLKELSHDPKNEVVIISGRDKKTMEEWFGTLELGLVAEHGVWIKQETWTMLEPVKSGWKEEVRILLEPYVAETPGSFVEEKGFSLVWHYREADPELGSTTANRLIHDLLGPAKGLDLQILEGNKVVEFKDASINKGRAALQWTTRRSWNFVLAIGDDRTDEYMFQVLPKTAYSVKVGLDSSLARFYLRSQPDVLVLLKELAKDVLSLKKSSLT